MNTVYEERCSGGLTPDERTIDAGGMNWHYLEWGDHGPPFVLWHGITSSALNWWRVGPFLAGLGFHVYAPDLPGHGLSDDAPGGYNVVNTALLLDAWLAALALDSPIILGHSWGGMNALTHALLPDPQIKPRAVVLEDPAVILADDPMDYLPSYTAELGKPNDAARRAEIAAANPRWHECDAWAAAEYRERARRNAVEGFFIENAGINAVERLSRIAAPVLILLGDPEYGGIWTAESIASIKQADAPNVTLEIVEGSTHNLHRDSFVPFSMALGAFVRRFLK
jgi:pimeloyl-ACP methyl ester carboxylesterase